MSFTLFLTKNNFDIVITQFSEYEPQYNLASTFNEKISIADNDQITFTFSIVKYIENNQKNPYLNYIKLGQTLTLLNDNRRYELVVTSIAPQITSHNLSYNVTCQDAFSYRMQRIRLGYSYSTVELGGVRTIYEIANDVVNEQGYGRLWRVSTYNPTVLTNSQLLTTKITLEVENSNPYNVLVEACNSLNASMYINYGDHTIHFYQKNATLFSGYRYHPEVNLKSINATYNFDEFATIMHVTGGTNEYGMQIMLVPPMPEAIKNFLAEYKETTGFDYLIDHKYIDIIYTIDIDQYIRINDVLVGNALYRNDDSEDIILEYNCIRGNGDPDSSSPNLSEFLYINDIIQGDGTHSAGYNYGIKIHYLHIDDDIELLRQEMEEVETFCLIADRVKTLGQFLYDFSYFRKNGLMSSQQYNELLNLFENRTPPRGTYTLVSINEQLRPITEQYYNLRWEFLQAFTDGSTLLEAIMADLNQIQKIRVGAVGDVTQEQEDNIVADKDKLIVQLRSTWNEQVISIYKTIYGNCIYDINNNLVPEIDEILNKINYYRQMLEEANTNYLEAQQKYYNLTNHLYVIPGSSTEDSGQLTEEQLNDVDIIRAQEEINYYAERFTLASQMVGGYIFENNERHYIKNTFCNGNMFDLNDLQLKVTVNDGVVQYDNTSLQSTLTEGCYYYKLYRILLEKILGAHAYDTDEGIVTILQNYDLTDGYINAVNTANSEINFEYNFVISPQQIENWIYSYLNSPNSDLDTHVIDVESVSNVNFTLNTNIVVIKVDKTNCEVKNISFIKDTKFNTFSGTLIRPDISYDAYYYNAILPISISAHYTYSYLVPQNIVTYGLYGKMLELQHKLDTLWKDIYFKYGEFIYETTYDNSEELDSLSLYNQAITYFENYKYPKSTYSISIVHPNELELMSTPNLLVNSHIRIYEDELNLKEGETYIENEENIEQGKIKLNNISYRPNELIVTGISYDLRKPEEASISVEQTIQYQSILQKLIKSVK